MFSTNAETFKNLENFLQRKYKLSYNTKNMITLRTETEIAPTMHKLADVIKSYSENVRIMITFKNAHGHQVVRELRKTEYQDLINVLINSHNTIPADTSMYDDYAKSFMYYHCSDANVDELHKEIQDYIDKYCPDWIGTFKITATLPQNAFAIEYNQSHDVKITLGIQISLLVNNSPVPNVVINSDGYVQFTNVTLSTNTITLVSRLNDFLWNKTKYLSLVDRNQVLNEVLAERDE